MFSISYGVGLFLLCHFVAFVEIQAEGKFGWGKKFPCWRPDPNSLTAKRYEKLMGGKELTGYHIAMFSLFFFILHLPFFAGIFWTLVKELETVSAFFMAAAFWDFLWFVWNPEYGLKKFKPEFAGWHKHWILKLFPRDYPIGIAISAAFSLLVVIFFEETIAHWGIVIGTMGGLTMISVILSFFIKIPKGRVQEELQQ